MFNVTHHSWFGPVEVELDPADGLTPEADHAFSNGQCHALAIALHDRTGWPLVGLEWDDEYGVDGVPNHVFVVNPNTGDGLDIGGWNAAGRWNGGYSDVRPIDRDFVLGALTEFYLEPNLDAANAYAEIVLREFAPDVLAA